MLREMITNTIAEHQLFSKGAHIVIALSGGADSVCLLHILLSLQNEYALKLSAVHINHHLRGAESDRDENFVKELCEQNAIPCFCEHFHVKEYAITNKIGIEEAGRKLRYMCLEEYRQKLKANVIATAHHGDDNIETFFMHLLRGAGLHGLTGIPYRNGHIVRPLLAVSKEQIINYLKANNLAFVTDSTNSTPDVLRNKIRLELLPLLEQYNPGLRRTLTRNIKLYQSADCYLHETAMQCFSALAEKRDNYIAFPLSKLQSEAAIIRYELYSLAARALLPASTVSSERIFDIDRCISAENGSVAITHNLTAQIFYDKLYFVKEDNHVKDLEYTLPLNQAVTLPETGITFYAAKKQKTTYKPKQNAIYLSYEKIKNHSICIRYRKNGDYFYPCGFQHRKRLQDFFVDKKIPRFMRDSIPLITVEDEIAWICGYRADKRFLPEPEENNILEIKFTEEKNER